MMEIVTERRLLMTEQTYRKPRKPSLILHGRIGRSILETIRNTPKPDDTKLNEEVEKLKAEIIKAKENGTF